MPTPAYTRFLQSMTLDYEKWHDGIGFDLDAIPEMSPDERRSLLARLTSGELTWREIEALETLHAHLPADQSPAITRALRRAATPPSPRDTRLAAAEALHRLGILPDLDATLAAELRSIDSITDGLTRLLLLAEEHPTDAVKQALLHAASRPTEAAMHCAALLCYLSGKAREPFDWDLRPFFLKFHQEATPSEREAAIQELLQLTNMTPTF